MAILQNAAEYGPRPNQSGSMDLPYRGADHQWPSQITMFPFIENCMYSTLLHVLEQARSMTL